MCFTPSSRPGRTRSATLLLLARIVPGMTALSCANGLAGHTYHLSPQCEEDAGRDCVCRGYGSVGVWSGWMLLAITHTHTHTRTHAHAHTHTYTHAHTHAHTCTQRTHTHTHTHTYTHTLVSSPPTSSSSICSLTFTRSV